MNFKVILHYMPPSHIRFISPKLKKSFLALEKGTSEEQDLFKAINTAFNTLEENCFAGIQIPKKLIPKEFKNQPNLWKMNLPKAWRLLYSIVGEEIITVSIVLEWLDHKSYEKRMRYT